MATFSGAVAVQQRPASTTIGFMNLIFKRHIYLLSLSSVRLTQPRERINYDGQQLTGFRQLFGLLFHETHKTSTIKSAAVFAEQSGNKSGAENDAVCLTA